MTSMDRGGSRTYADSAKAYILGAVTKQCESCGTTVSATRADGVLEKCPACHHTLVTEILDTEAHDNVAGMMCAVEL